MGNFVGIIVIKRTINYFKLLVLVKAVKQENIPTWKEVIDDSVLNEFKLQFSVNFSYGTFLSILQFVK